MYARSLIPHSMQDANLPHVPEKGRQSQRSDSSISISVPPLLCLFEQKRVEVRRWLVVAAYCRLAAKTISRNLVRPRQLAALKTTLHHAGGNAFIAFSAPPSRKDRWLHAPVTWLSPHAGRQKALLACRAGFSTEGILGRWWLARLAQPKASQPASQPSADGRLRCRKLQTLSGLTESRKPRPQNVQIKRHTIRG